MESYAVIGLGYVGLQVAVALADHVKVIGYDINEERIEKLKQGEDVTKVVKKTDLKKTNLIFTTDLNTISDANFYFVIVSTPAYYYEFPDLVQLINATRSVAKVLKRGDTVVFESTVYPGTTEEICIPILEKRTGMKSGQDFYVGYSPERINPGDSEHTLKNTPKVVSGQDKKALQKIKKVYDLICETTFVVSSIKTAEAVKVLENTQRDVNIALMNEFVKITHAQNLEINEIIKAASTKWSFVTFRPGLVGGHCVPVDPYYLSFKAKRLGIEPRFIVTAREINNQMSRYIVETLLKLMINKDLPIKQAKIGIFGIAYKANIPDIRNSMSLKMIKELKEYGFDPCVFDPVIDAKKVQSKYGFKCQSFEELQNLSAIIIVQGHNEYSKIGFPSICTKLKKNGVLVDVANQFYQANLPADRDDLLYWSL